MGDERDAYLDGMYSPSASGYQSQDGNVSNSTLPKV
jgi:hypothetical protein